MAQKGVNTLVVKAKEEGKGQIIQKEGISMAKKKSSKGGCKGGRKGCQLGSDLIISFLVVALKPSFLFRKEL